jgi:FeS assembly SUF system protein
MFSLLRKNKGPTSKPGKVLQAQIVAALKGVYDPEIPVNIYDLGLIYDMEVKDGGEVTVAMTLTAPACPVAGILPKQVETAVHAVEGVTQVSIELVWDPPWGPERMSDEARLSLGLL